MTSELRPDPRGTPSRSTRGPARAARCRRADRAGRRCQRVAAVGRGNQGAKTVLPTSMGGRRGPRSFPGWAYSIVAALQPGRTSWTTVLDTIRMGPHGDMASREQWNPLTPEEADLRQRLQAQVLH